MRMSIDELDREIREIESRIARERVALEQAVHGCTDGVRDAVTSPATLIALLGLGYGIGKLMFGGKNAAPGPAPKAVGMLGLLTGIAGTALSLMQPRLGVGSIARWAATRALASRKAKAAAAAATPRPAAVRAPRIY